MKNYTRVSREQLETIIANLIVDDKKTDQLDHNLIFKSEDDYFIDDDILEFL